TPLRGWAKAAKRRPYHSPGREPWEICSVRTQPRSGDISSSLKKPAREEPKLARFGSEIHLKKIWCVENCALNIRSSLLLQRILDLAGKFEPARAFAKENLRDSHMRVLFILGAILRSGCFEVNG